jgi:hypothetical protein
MRSPCLCRSSLSSNEAVVSKNNPRGTDEFREAWQRIRRGAPIATFGYLDQAKATNARALIEKAIVDVALITAAGAHE